MTKLLTFISIVTFTISTALASPAEISKDFTIVYGSTPKAGVIIFPGAYLKSTQYLSLASNIVDESRGTLSVYIAKFALDFANPIQANRRVQKVVNEFADMGFTSPEKRVFLAGHSQGGIMASGVAKSKNLAGLILLGSYLPETALIGQDFDSYPIPTLTLGGDLDGLTGINFLSREFGKLQSISRNNFNKRYKMPVVVLEGVNHMQFADGSFLDGDLKSEISLPEAHLAMATVIGKFINLQLNHEISTSRSFIDKALEKSKIALTPLLEALKIDQNLCRSSQRIAAGLETNDYNQLSIEEKIYRRKSSYPAFIIDKSKVNSKRLYLASYIESSLNLFDVSQDTRLGAQAVACKMRSQTSIVEATGFIPINPQLTCAELNYQALRKAYGLIQSELQRMRIDLNLGIDFSKDFSLDFEPQNSTYDLEAPGIRILDTLKERGDQWALGSNISLNKVNGSWALQTYSLVTSTQAVGNFGGAYYCKVLPVSQFVEWLQMFHMK